MSKSHVYAKEKIYRVRKYGSTLFEGTWNDILSKLQISESTLRYYISDSYKKRIYKNDSKRLIIEEIER